MLNQPECPPAPESAEQSRNPKSFYLQKYPLYVFSNADSAGESTGGSETTLQDTTQYWETNMWQGAMLIISIDDVPYFTFITSNTEQQLVFPAFASTVKISQNRYAIKSFGASTPSQTKAATKILSETSIAAGATSPIADCDAINMVYGVSSLTITVACAFNAAAVSGIKVHVLSSYDGTSYDTVDFDSWTPTFTAGATIQQTKVYNTSPAYLKVLIENLDGAQAVTTVSVISTVQGG